MGVTEPYLDQCPEASVLALSENDQGDMESEDSEHDFWGYRPLLLNCSIQSLKKRLLWLCRSYKAG